MFLRVRLVGGRTSLPCCVSLRSLRSLAAIELPASRLISQEFRDIAILKIQVAFKKASAQERGSSP